MSKKTNEVLFDDLGDSLANDLLQLDVVPDDEIDDLLTAWGGNPRAIGRAGADSVRVELDRRRLSWMDEADAKARQFRAILDEAATDVDGMSDEEVRWELERMRRAESVGGALRAAFLKRAPESAAPAERREMLRQARRLAALSRRSGGSDDQS